MVKAHEEVLSKAAIKVADKLKDVANDDFYLAGGTGLALQIGHRISIDFDFFSKSNELLESDRLKIITKLKKLGDIDVREASTGTCHFFFDKVALSIFHYPYPLIKKPEFMYKGIRVASEFDIAAMKLSAIIGRGSKKDFVDLFFLADRHGLKKIIETSAKKFKDHKNFLIQTTRALVYFEDAEKEPMPKMLKNANWDKIKIYFEKETNKILKATV